MKRLALGVAALAVLASLSSCSDDSGSDDSAPESSTSTSEEATEAPAEEATEEATDGDPERFATAYAQVSALFTELNSTQPDAQPTSTEEANAAAGLDDTTALIFADYSVLPDETGGSLCLLSDTGTYVAVTYADATGEVDLGDGECSYDTASALVVGDIATDTWTLGAELMGDAVPTGVFGS
jgi:hypothetical protein